MVKQPKYDFINRTRKNKAGEVCVIKHKSGFRTLNVTGKVEIPSFFSNYPHILQHIITEVGGRFLGLFPFLDKRRDKNICTYSFPETIACKKAVIELTYDFLYTVAAVDINANDILEQVLNLNSIISEQILDKLDKEMEEAYGESG